jgi:hypothetical protein
MAARKRKTTKRTSTSKRKTGRKKSARKGASRKSTSRKRTTRKKTARKKGSRRNYSRSTGNDVGQEMHEYKRGQARSGRSGKKVKSRKQAIAIGLSKARRKGKRVPPRPKR